MNFDLTTTLFYFIGIALVVIAGVYGATVNQIMGIRVHRPKFQLKDQTDIPGYLQDVYKDAVTQLNALGFEFHHCQLSNDIIAHEHADKWSLVLLNRQTQVYAELSPASTFLDLPGYEVDFWSIAKDGTALITINGRGYTVLCNIPGAELHDPMAASIADIYESHLAEQKDVFADKPVVNITPTAYTKLQQKLMDGYFLNLLKEGGVVSTGNNIFRITLPKAINLVRQLKRGEKQLKKLIREKIVAQHTTNTDNNESTATATNEFNVEAEVNAYHRLSSAQEKTPGSTASKLFVFIITLAFSYLAFGLVFSFSSVLILMAVILFHELGHIAAMYAFKYRNLQILFIPLIGAAATGKKDDIAIWKQVIVYLMGPLPGIFVGIGLIALYQQYQAPWLYETAIIMLLINYLNLLPFVPLDGGHIVRLTIMERFPTGKLMFSALSGLAFIAGAWYLGEPIFWILAIVMLSSLPMNALEAGLLSELYQQPSQFDSLNKDQKLKKIFETLKQSKFQKLQFVQKFNLVKSLSDVVLQSRHLSRLGSLGLNGIYLGALLLTPPAFVITVMGIENASNMASLMTNELPGRDWDAKIAQETSAHKRFEIMLQASQFFATTNDMMKAQGYLDQAERTFALINTDSALAELYQTYYFYYQHNQDLPQAEEYLLKAIKLHRQLPEHNALILATNYQTMASLHYQQKRYEDFETDLKTGLSFALRTQKPEERFVISTLVNQLLERYYSNNQQKIIKTLLEDTLSTTMQYTDPLTNYVSSYLYQELGRYYAEQDDISTAMQQFDHALALTTNNAPRDGDLSDPLVKANIYLDMAAIQFAAGNMSLAQTHIESAEKIIKANYFESLNQYIENQLPPEMLDKLQDNTDRETTRWKAISKMVQQINPASATASVATEKGTELPTEKPAPDQQTESPQPASQQSDSQPNMQ